MKITIYELLGMIKDGKAPRKIKYINSIWKYDKETKDYFNNDLWLIYSMNSIGLTEREVEIIEEPQEHKIPEKLTETTLYGVPILNKKELSNITLTNKRDIVDIKDKINEILDYLEEKE